MGNSNNPLVKALSLPDPSRPPSPSQAHVESADTDITDFEEVNLLDGLADGPTFSNASLSLTTGRLGQVSRQKLFSLPMAPLPEPSLPSPSPLTAARTAHPTLRKAFRKTLSTVSGFRVRMRTVFVPTILMADDSDLDDERLDAGNEERSIVLCVEIENSGEAGPSVGFEVNKIDVSISGEGGASAALIGGEHFPVQVGSREQYNLLYAVSFMRSPEEAASLSTLATELKPSDLRRAVSINIFGKPYIKQDNNAPLVYPTGTFSSKWNCLLDLQNLHTEQPPSMQEDTDRPEILPEPASPFPVTVTSAGSPGDRSAAPSPPPGFMSAGASSTRRHTLGDAVVSRNIKSALPGLSINRQSVPALPRRSSLVPALSPSGTPPASQNYTPPSLSPSTQIPKSPTTFDEPPTPMQMAMTPAYPAFGGPMSPYPQTPVGTDVMGNLNQSYVSPSVDIPRQKGLASFAPGGGGTPTSGLPPQTPFPVVGGGMGGGSLGGGSFADQQQTYFQAQGHNQSPTQHSYSHLQRQVQPSYENQEKDIVVSIGLMDERRKLYPMSYFTLDIFVFNRSEETKRFEVGYPTRAKKLGREKGLVPMENRVRIG